MAFNSGGRTGGALYRREASGGLRGSNESAVERLGGGAVGGGLRQRRAGRRRCIGGTARPGRGSAAALLQGRGGEGRGGRRVWAAGRRAAR